MSEEMETLTSRRLLTCLDTTAWISPFSGTTINMIIGSGNETVVFPSFTFPLGCNPGTPDIDYTGPEGSCYDIECDLFSTPTPSYNSSTQKWFCPNGFTMNTITPCMWTDGYQLKVNTSCPTLLVGGTYEITIIY